VLLRAERGPHGRYLLLEYSIDQGGSRADISARTWSGSAWGPAADLDVNSVTCGENPFAAGTINSSAIPFGESDGLIASGSKQPRTFGEAQIDLRLLFQPNKCASFGSAMLKSRSSASFTAAGGLRGPGRHQPAELRPGDHPQEDQPG